MDNSDDAGPARLRRKRRGCGFVFATTGELYTVLARRAARTMRLHMPKASIDLFTDQEIADPVFDVVHRLEKSWFRPKMEAIYRSRFRRTIYLDADMLCLDSIAEVFTLLDRFDVAGVHAAFRNTVRAFNDLPRAFPEINGGLLALRSVPRTDALIIEWEKRMIAQQEATDQPTLRRLLYESDLRLAVLPPEYNFLHLNMLKSWHNGTGAPRILHLPALHQNDPGDPLQHFDLAEVIGPRRAELVQALLRADLIQGSLSENF